MPSRGHRHTGGGTQADVQAGSESDVVPIRIEGNRRVEAEVGQAGAEEQGGSTLRPGTHRRGHPSRCGRWATSRTSSSSRSGCPRGIAYVVRVSERPSVREWRLQGNEELTKDDFKDTIDLKPYQILDLDAVRRNVKKIQEKYVEKGFFLAEVTYRIVPSRGRTRSTWCSSSTSTRRSW